MPGTPGSNVTEESKHWRLGTHRIRPWMSCLACEGCCVVSLEQCSIFDPRESVFFGLVCVCVCFVLGKLDWGCVFESGIYGRVIPIENMSYYIGFWLWLCSDVFWVDVFCRVLICCCSCVWEHQHQIAIEAGCFHWFWHLFVLMSGFCGAYLGKTSPCHIVHHGFVH